MNLERGICFFVGAAIAVMFVYGCFAFGMMVAYYDRPPDMQIITASVATMIPLLGVPAFMLGISDNKAKKARK